MTVWDIKSLSMFKGLNPFQIHNLISNARKVRYKKGSLMCNFSEKSRDIFIIIRGSVKVLSKSGEIIGILQEKEIFNEVGFVYDLPYCTSFVATEETVVAVIGKKLIENLSKTDPAIQNTLLRNILLSLRDKSATFEKTSHTASKNISQSNAVSCIQPV